jgi:hypothetical protein
MIRKVSNVEIVVPTVLAVALAIVLSIGAIYLAEIFLGPIEQVEAHRSAGRWLPFHNQAPGATLVELGLKVKQTWSTKMQTTGSCQASGKSCSI